MELNKKLNSTGRKKKEGVASGDTYFTYSWYRTDTY